MKTKKTTQANLENKRTLFIQVGLILALSVILAAFEWNSKVEFKPMVFNNSGVETIELNMPITKPVEEKKVIKPMVPFEKLLIEKNTVEIKDAPLFLPEDNWDDPVPTFEKTAEPEDLKEHISVEIMPTFMGQNAMYFRNYVAQNIKFPKEASENGLGGKVYVSFVVGKDGFINKVEILRGVHPIIDEAVIKVIENSPRWEPGIQSGRYVMVRFSIMINFEIKN